MSPHLRPCPACGRHVRTSDFVCPFCAAALPESFRGATAPLLPTQRLGRAALVAFGLLGAPACTDDALTLPDSGAGGAMNAGGTGGLAMNTGGAGMTGAGGVMPDAGNIGPVYGAPASDAALYGAPPDARFVPPPPDASSVGPVYGAPVPADAGDAAVDRAAPVNIYGAPSLPRDDGGRPVKP